MDCAICQKDLRKQLLCILSNPVAVLKKSAFNHVAIGWLTKRSLSIEKFCYTKDCDASLFKSYVKRNGQHIRSLIISQPNIFDWMPILQEIAKCCSNLSKIELWKPEHDFLDKSLASQFPGSFCNLEDMFVSVSGQFMPSMDLFKFQYPKLHILYIQVEYDIDMDSLIVKVAKSCHRLVNLTVALIPSGTHPITDVAYQSISSNCPLLKRLDLYLPHNITDVALLALMNGCPDLESTNVLRNRGLSSNGYITFLNGCYRLTSVALGKYNSDEHVIIVAQNCSNLHTLSFCFCSLITDAALLVVARCCHRLKSIWMNQCGQITYAAISAIVKHCLLLESIKIYHMNNITTAAFDDILKRCKKISRIEKFNGIEIELVANNNTIA